MREVIRGLVEAEGEARRIVQSTRAEAEVSVSEAEKRAQDILFGARADSKSAAEKEIDVAVEEARREKQKRLEKAAAQMEAQVRLDGATEQCAVDAIIRCVCGCR